MKKQVTIGEGFFFSEVKTSCGFRSFQQTVTAVSNSEKDDEDDAVDEPGIKFSCPPGLKVRPLTAYLCLPVSLILCTFLFQEYYVRIPAKHKPLFVAHLVLDRNIDHVLVFVNARPAATRLAQLLTAMPGLKAAQVSGGLAVQKRERLLKQFTNGELQVGERRERE